MQGFTQLSSTRSISFVDSRAVLANIDNRFEELRADKAEIKTTYLAEDILELNAKFAELVVERLNICKEVRLSYLQGKIAREGWGLDRITWSTTLRWRPSCCQSFVGTKP